MKKIIKAGQRFVRRRYDSLDDARKELADEPYKLELIDLKGGRGLDTVDTSEVMEVGEGELTAYDNVHAHTGETVWSDLCRGPHLPTTKYIPAFTLHAHVPRRTGGGARRTRSCSASTAPRGRARRPWTRTCTGWPRPSGATTAGSAPSWTCSRSPTRSAPGWPCSTPRAG